MHALLMRGFRERRPLVFELRSSLALFGDAARILCPSELHLVHVAASGLDIESWYCGSALGLDRCRNTKQEKRPHQSRKDRRRHSWVPSDGLDSIALKRDGIPPLFQTICELSLEQC